MDHRDKITKSWETEEINNLTQDYVRLKHETIMSRYRDRLYARYIGCMRHEYEEPDPNNTS